MLLLKPVIRVGENPVRLINEPCLCQCASRKYYFVVVQLTIEIYSLPISTANGIKFRWTLWLDNITKIN
jgi:hypothetical protein